LTINNLGFILFFNRTAAKFMGVKEKDVLGTQVKNLFSENPGSSLVASFCDPARTKSAGLHPSQQVVLANGRKLEVDLLLIRTDLKEEVHYSMLILSSH